MLSNGISVRSVLAVFFCLLSILFLAVAPSFGASVSLNVTVDGGAVNASVSGSFASCTTCDANGQNCVTTNNGTVNLFLDNGSFPLCSASGAGNASCSKVIDRATLQDTHTFKGYAGDCKESVSKEYALSLNDLPTISLTSPSGTIRTPDTDIVGTAVFPPTLNQKKGVIQLTVNGGSIVAQKTCTTETCTFSYLETKNTLYHFGDGTHTIKLFAYSSANKGASDTRTVTIDTTPTVSIISPSGTLRAADANITGTATFVPTSNPTKGIIQLIVDNSNVLAQQTCPSETCTFSYQAIKNALYHFEDGNHTIKLYAYSSNNTGALDTKTVFVDTSPTVSITSPQNKTNSPFDIAGTATFVPTAASKKGIIQLTVDGSGVLLQEDCYTESCSFSYQKKKGVPYSASNGPHTIKLHAYSANNKGAVATRVTTVTDCAVITSFDASPRSFTASGGGTVTLTGTITAGPGSPIKWKIDVAGRSLTGSGNTATAVWDGRDANGNIPPLGKGTAKLTAWIDGNSGCPADEAELNYTVKEPPKDQCSAPIIDFGSKANVASGNLNHDQLLFSVAGAKHITGCTLTYNSADSFTGVLGKGWTHSFNIQLIAQPDDTYTVRDGDGSTVSLIKNGDYYSPETSAYPSLQKNTDGTFFLHYKNGITYAFDAAGKITGINDLNSNQTAFSYDASGRLAGVSDPSGRSMTFIYNAGGQIQTITDPNGNTHAFTYTGTTLTQVTTTPVSGTARSWSYTYDPQGFMLSKTDPLGKTTSYTYDANHRITVATDPEGRARNLQYNQTATTSTLTEKDGGVWTFTYDPDKALLTAKTDPLGKTTVYMYDNFRNLTSRTDPDGSVTRYTHDAYGNVLTVTDALNNVTRYTYNDLDKVTSITDARGQVTTYTYDTRGNLTARTDALGNVTQFAYDTLGNLLSVTLPTGQVTSFTYDTSFRLGSVTEPSGARTTFAYDGYGNLKTATDALGNITTLTYDSLNQLTKATNPLNKATQYAYDLMGNTTVIKDANSRSTTYGYNYRGQVNKITDALGYITTMAYSGSGCASCQGNDKLVSLTDASANITHFQYDQVGRLVNETDPAGNITSFAYDAVGNPTQKTKADGTAVAYAYDKLGRLIQKTFPDGSITTYQYDANGNLTGAANQHSAYSFTYDALNRLTTVLDNNNRTIQYEYDAADNRTKMTAPDGAISTYAYDTNNRLGSISNDLGTFTFSYDAANRKTKQLNPNGSSVNYTYDKASRITKIEHKTAGGGIIGSFAYTYDSVGNRLTKVEPQGTSTYTYDATYQLRQSANPALGTEAYVYDKTGNRTRETIAAVITNYTSAKGNRIKTRGTDTFTHDANGNIVSKTGSGGTTTYGYDADNRLIRAVMPNGTIAEYKYDPLGRRVEKAVTMGGVTTVYRYLYDGANILNEYDAAGNVTNKYTHNLAIDDPLALQTGGQTYYYHKDAQGTVTQLTDTTGTTVQTYTYDAYGNIKTPSITIAQPYMYTGREYDSETGLFFYRARQYDARTGRFLQKDPVGFNAGDVNVYRYVKNRPTRFIDPSGLLASWWHYGITYIAVLAKTGDHGTATDMAVKATAVDDAPGSQGIDVSATSQHAMRGYIGEKDRFQSPWESDLSTKKYINDNKCRNLPGAIHAAQDSNSSAHNGMVWNGELTLRHLINDMLPSPATIYRSFIDTYRLLGNGK